jgi:hypothetical protein
VATAVRTVLLLCFHWFSIWFIVNQIIICCKVWTTIVQLRPFHCKMSNPSQFLIELVLHIFDIVMLFDHRVRQVLDLQCQVFEVPSFPILQVFFSLVLNLVQNAFLYKGWKFLSVNHRVLHSSLCKVSLLS